MMAPVSGSMGNPKSLIADWYTSKAAVHLCWRSSLPGHFINCPLSHLTCNNPAHNNLPIASIIGTWSFTASQAGGVSNERARFANVDSGNLRPQAEAERPETLPAGADAGAAVPLQSRVRRVRQDSVSGSHSETQHDAGRMFPRGGRMRDSDGGDPRRRAA